MSLEVGEDASHRSEDVVHVAVVGLVVVVRWGLGSGLGVHTGGSTAEIGEVELDVVDVVLHGGGSSDPDRVCGPLVDLVDTAGWVLEIFKSLVESLQHKVLIIAPAHAHGAVGVG